MYNGHKINVLLKAGNYQVKDLLEALDLKKANGSITQIVKGNPTAKRLEIIADFFGVSIDSFFDRKKYDKKESESCSLHEDANIFYEKLLAEKDKRIDLLERMNLLLTHEIERLLPGQNSDN